MLTPRARKAAEAQRRGALALREGRLAEAATHLARALKLDPAEPETHASLAGLHHRAGRWALAARHGLRLLELRPGQPDPAAHLLVGDALHRLGRPAEALPHLARVAQLAPHSVPAWCNLATVCAAAGEVEQALRHLDHAARLGGDPAIRHRAAGLRYARGDVAGALEELAEALRLGETAEGKALFAQCLLAHAAPLPEPLHPLALRALTEPWGRPTDIAPAIIATLLAAGIATRPPEVLARDGMLLALLVTARIADTGLEAVLTAARRALLLEARPEEASLPFACALARQCFLNEYVFAVTEEEAAALARLQDRLAAGGAAAFEFALLGCYRPLGVPGLALPEDARLAPVIAQQVAEPAEEAALRPAIPVLTAISDEVSRLVRAQYEENPYPRWALAAPAEEGLDLNLVMRNGFPAAAFVPLAQPRAIDILIAGCGTGRVAQEVARRFPTSGEVLAVDLSLASLAYAMRQARRDRVAGLAYAQADILRLPELGRRFDLIDASGVLHHMAEPFAAWRVLLGLLRPGGCMRVGLYSELGRQDIVAARGVIAGLGLPATAAGIRQARQLILAHPDALVRAVARRGDFYSLSECRDLLFHVHEMRLRLPEIVAFLRAEGLTFLGFDLPAAVAREFEAAHPDPAAQADPAAWVAFEESRPDAFGAMYQLWVQKPAGSA